MAPTILMKVALILCGAAAVLTSMSLDLEEKAKSAFNAVDQNHDGVLTFAEFQAVFDSLDTNNFATTAPDILKKATLILCGAATVLTSMSLDLEEKAKSAFNAVDQNHDGVLTFAEFQAFFDSLDTNKDGVWTLEEYSRLSEGTPVPPDVRARFSYFDGLDGQVDNKAHKSGMEEPIKQYDINGDGQVTEQEFVKYFVESIQKFTTLTHSSKP